MTILRTGLALFITVALIPQAFAATVNGTLRVGGVSVDETGDRSVMQETYNLFDGFNLRQIYLNGTSSETDRFMVDLHEVNHDSRRGAFSYRRPGLFKLDGRFDQNTRIFTPNAAATARRNDWKVGGQLSPLKWLGISAQAGSQSREGSRLSYPEGTVGVLGSEYDSELMTGRVALQVRRGAAGGAIAYDVSDFTDDLNNAADRTGHLVSGRLYAPDPFYDKWTHLFRASFGVRELANATPDHTLSSFRYTGVVAPLSAIELKYSFDASRIEDESTDLQTDRIENEFDAAYFYKYGQLSGGYAYETNDDDRNLTEYHSWRAGTVFRYEKFITARVNYAGRIKKDLEELTLLKDVESNRIRARLQVQPIEWVSFGGGYSWREREFPDIQVESEGDVANAFARLSYADWGSLSGEYTYTDDSYDDLVAGFESTSDIVTGRMSFDRIDDLRVSGGVTFLDIDGDLDVEKTLFFVEGNYTVMDDYHLEFKYNAYNYDDFILLDRYYTANVLWFGLGYDFNL